MRKKKNIRIRSGDRYKYMDDLRCFLNSRKEGWRWQEDTSATQRDGNRRT